MRIETPPALRAVGVSIRTCRSFYWMNTSDKVDILYINYYETESMTGILEQLKWESLKKMKKESILIMLYKGLKGAASIPTNDLIPPIRHTRNHHSLAFQTPLPGTEYKSSFFPQTIRVWNTLTDSLISASKCADGSVAKFTCLISARD